MVDKYFIPDMKNENLGSLRFIYLYIRSIADRPSLLYRRPV